MSTRRIRWSSRCIIRCRPVPRLGSNPTRKIQPRTRTGHEGIHQEHLSSLFVTPSCPLCGRGQVLLTERSEHVLRRVLPAFAVSLSCCFGFGRAGQARPRPAKAFWFFFSKKNRFCAGAGRSQSFGPVLPPIAGGSLAGNVSSSDLSRCACSRFAA